MWRVVQCSDQYHGPFFIVDITLIGRFACQAVRIGAGKVEGDGALMLSGSSSGEELTTLGSCISLSQT